MAQPFERDLDAAVADGVPFVLGRATVPACLLDGVEIETDDDGLALADIRVESGRVAWIRRSGGHHDDDGARRVDLDRGMALPLFVDMHTHLDKGHIWPRRRNPDGRFMSALMGVKADRELNWTVEDVRRRMDFSLRSAFANGTRAIRTHIDSIPPQEAISWPVLAEVRTDWAGRIELQAVSLVGPDTAMEPETLDRLARVVRPMGGVFGGALSSFPSAREAIGNLVATAMRHELDLDLHLDETADAASDGLRIFAETILATGFSGRAVAGHCCSLARQEAHEADRTLDLVAKAGIAVVSLPMCNLNLQDRQDLDGGSRRTPRWRGVTLVSEMKARGIPVAVASDNTRDPFYAYGDLDGLEVLREATRILHLDHPVDDAPTLMTRAPADILGLSQHGRIGAGRAADLALFRGRTWTELYARPQTDRVVLRDGRPSRAALPDYRELDDLFGART